MSETRSEVTSLVLMKQITVKLLWPLWAGMYTFRVEPERDNSSRIFKSFWFILFILQNKGLVTIVIHP